MIFIRQMSEKVELLAWKLACAAAAAYCVHCNPTKLLCCLLFVQNQQEEVGRQTHRVVCQKL